MSTARAMNAEAPASLNKIERRKSGCGNVENSGIGKKLPTSNRSIILSCSKAFSQNASPAPLSPNKSNSPSPLINATSAALFFKGRPLFFGTDRTLFTGSQGRQNSEKENYSTPFKIVSCATTTSWLSLAARSSGSLASHASHPNKKKFDLRRVCGGFFIHSVMSSD